jgi:hypothetical protein
MMPPPDLLPDLARERRVELLREMAAVRGAAGPTRSLRADLARRLRAIADRIEPPALEVQRLHA